MPEPLHGYSVIWIFWVKVQLSKKKIHQGQLRVVQSPVPQMNGEDVYFLLSWWTYRIFHFSSQIPYEPCYQNKICLWLSTWVACDLPEVRMPADLRDFKRVKKNQCFKTGIRNDFPWKRQSTGHHEDVRDKVQTCIWVENCPQVEIFSSKIYWRVDKVPFSTQGTDFIHSFW